MRILNGFLGLCVVISLGCGGGAKVVVDGDASSGDSLWLEDGALAEAAGELAGLDGVGEDGEPVDPDAVAADALVSDSAQDGVEPGDLSTPDSGGPHVLVSTYAPASSIPAGVSMDIQCLVQGLPEGSYVTYLSVLGPSEVDVDDKEITFYKVGTYKVACVAAWNGGQASDETPVKLEVLPGTPAHVQTDLTDNDVLAGATVYATCLVTDSWGNQVDVASQLFTNPTVGLDIMGMRISAIKAGTYQVTCFEPTAQISDLTPETLVVGWNMPQRLETTLGSDVITAGQSTSVTCKAYDAYDNMIPDFPMVVFLAHGLTITGFNVGGTKVGTFQVACVPLGEDWSLFVLDPKALQVLPAAAASVTLKAVPPKPVYRMFESVDFLATAHDVYGNLVPDAVILPLYYNPNTPDVVQKGPMRYKFEAEGTYEFFACLGNNPSICGTILITVDGYGPIITIDYPPRGATLNGKPAVVVLGNVTDQVGVASFEINGDYVPRDANGDFSYSVSSVHGLNFVVAVAEDTTGLKTLHVQSYYYSPVWNKTDINDPAGSKLYNAMLFFLGAAFFDVNPHDYSEPTNLSTILEMAVQTLDIGSFLPNPVAEAGPYKVYLGPFSYNPPEIHIYPIDSAVRAWTFIQNLKIRVQAKGTCKVLFIDFCPDVSGWVSVEGLEFYLTLGIALINNSINVQKKELTFNLINIDVDIDGILGFLFGWIVDWLVDSYTETLEETAVEMVSDQLEGLLLGLTDQLKLEMALDVPNPLDPSGEAASLLLTSDISELNVDHSGIRLWLSPAVLAATNQPHQTLGSIGRANCLAYLPEEFDVDEGSDAHIAIHDDLINQILFSAWNSGLLNMTVPVDSFLDPAMLSDFGISSLSELGLSDLVAVTDFWLPPIVTSCNGYNQLELQVGDIYVELQMKLLNQPVSIGMFASMAAEADIEILPGPTGPVVTLGVGEIDPMIAQITYVSPGLEGAEGVLTMIIQGMLLPSLLGSFAETSLVNFPIPQIDISSLSTMLPAGIVWQFAVDEFYRYLGYTAIKAHVEAP